MQRRYRGFVGSVLSLSLGLAGCETMPPPTATAFAVTVTIVATVISGLIVRRRLDHLDLIAVLKTRD